MTPRVLLALLLVPLASASLASSAMPDWAQAVYRFDLPPAEAGTPWRIAIDGEGRFHAGLAPAAPLAPACAQPQVCATNADQCATTTLAPACDGVTNGLAAHAGPFLLLGFTGTIAHSASGGAMVDRLVYDCDGRDSCLPSDTVELTCTFAPGTTHLAEVWGSEGGECRFTSWNGYLSGHAFTFHGAQRGDLAGDVSHTVD